MRLFTTLLTLALAAPAFASGPGDKTAGATDYVGQGRMTYALFENAVTHVDLDTCPVEFDDNAAFCRMTLASDMAHIFVFSYNGDQLLLAVKDYELTDGFLPF